MLPSSVDPVVGHYALGATRKIISQGFDEDFEAVDAMAMEGVEPFLYKFGAMTRMPEGMARSFGGPDPEGRTVFHPFTGLLRSGVLTCYSSNASPCHVMPFIHAVLDQYDR